MCPGDMCPGGMCPGGAEDRAPRVHLTGSISSMPAGTTQIVSPQYGFEIFCMEWHHALASWPLMRPNRTVYRAAALATSTLPCLLPFVKEPCLFNRTVYLTTNGAYYRVHLRSMSCTNTWPTDHPIGKVAAAGSQKVTYAQCQRCVLLNLAVPLS